MQIENISMFFQTLKEHGCKSNVFKKALEELEELQKIQRNIVFFKNKKDTELRQETRNHANLIVDVEANTAIIQNLNFLNREKMVEIIMLCKELRAVETNINNRTTHTNTSGFMNGYNSKRLSLKIVKICTGIE